MNQYAMKGLALNKADLAASFQENVSSTLTEKTMEAAKAFGVRQVLLAGGVAANSGLRRKITEACGEQGPKLYLPEPRYCTDNAAMVACAGYHRLVAGFRDDLTLNAEPSLGMAM